MAYPQAPVECDMYMKIPRGYHLNDAKPGTHVLKLIKNLYGGRASGRIWYEFLDAGLRKIGFKPSNLDPCLFYRGNVIFLVYVDDGLFFSPDKTAIDQAFADLVAAKFDIEDQGDISDYLGVKVTHLPDGTIKLTQPLLIESILKDLHFQDNTTPREVPAHTTRILQRDPDGTPMEPVFHYRGVIGKLNFLEKSIRPDIAYAVHQCARFCENPKRSHALAVKRIGKYLQGTRDKGLIIDPKADRSFDCYVDADFCGLWDQGSAAQDSMTSKSRTGYVIMYAGCPIVWASTLQTQTALSTTEAEYVALSTALREQIPLMELIKEMQKNQVDVEFKPPKVHCTAFEDNSGALELALLPKIRPRTKHINNTYHHFREYVASEQIEVLAIPTDDQIADIFTKPIALPLFAKHRLLIMGW
jgi:histone deacetylase 1/2